MNKAEIRPTLLRFAQNPQHEDQWKAIHRFLHDKPEYKVLVLPLLIEAASLSSHPKHTYALDMFWTFRGPDWVDARARFRPTRVSHALEEMNQTTHWDQWLKIWRLWNSEHEDREANRQDLAPHLQKFVTDPSHSLLSSTHVALKLWHAGGEHRHFAHPILLERIPQDADVGFLIIHMFWQTGHDIQEDMRRQIRPELIRVAETPAHPYQREAIHFLRESNDPEDQALGLRLQLEHFPVIYSEAAA